MIDKTIQGFIDLHNTFEAKWDSCRSNSFRFAGVRDDKTETSFASLREWKWSGKPSYECLMYRIVNREVFAAPIAECLTSPSEYVRECKKYFMEEERIRAEWNSMCLEK